MSQPPEGNAAAPPGTIYIIRHGEKPADPPAVAPGQAPPAPAPPFGVDFQGNQNPHSLLPRGWPRSGTLTVLFDPAVATPQARLRTPAALPSPSYGHPAKTAAHRTHRTHQTIQGLSDRLLQIVSTFAEGQESELAASVVSGYPGVVLICWEHDHIPALASSLPAVPGTAIPRPGLATGSMSSGRSHWCRKPPRANTPSARSPSSCYPAIATRLSRRNCPGANYNSQVSVRAERRDRIRHQGIRNALRRRTCPTFWLPRPPFSPCITTRRSPSYLGVARVTIWLPTQDPADLRRSLDALHESLISKVSLRRIWLMFEACVPHLRPRMSTGKDTCKRSRPRQEPRNGGVIRPASDSRSRRPMCTGQTHTGR